MILFLTIVLKIKLINFRIGVVRAPSRHAHQAVLKTLLSNVNHSLTCTLDICLDLLSIILMVRKIYIVHMQISEDILLSISRKASFEVKFLIFLFKKWFFEHEDYKRQLPLDWIQNGFHSNLNMQIILIEFLTYCRKEEGPLEFCCFEFFLKIFSIFRFRWWMFILWFIWIIYKVGQYCKYHVILKQNDMVLILHPNFIFDQFIFYFIEVTSNSFVGHPSTNKAIDSQTNTLASLFGYQSQSIKSQYGSALVSNYASIVVP